MCEGPRYLLHPPTYVESASNDKEEPVVARVQELSIEEFSIAFIAHQRLPRTCKLVMQVLKDKRTKRSDALVKMYPLRMPRVVRVDNESHVSDLLDVAKN